MKTIFARTAAIALGLGLIGGGAAFAADTATQGGTGHKGNWQQEHLDKMFNNFDANHDGKVSQDEFLDRMKEKFKKLDTNGDGYVTKDEAEKFAQDMHERRSNMHRMHHGAAGGTSGGGSTGGSSTGGSSTGGSSTGGSGGAAQ
jgi:hypothetical protein